MAKKCILIALAGLVIGGMLDQLWIAFGAGLLASFLYLVTDEPVTRRAERNAYSGPVTPAGAGEYYHEEIIPLTMKGAAYLEWKKTIETQHASLGAIRAWNVDRPLSDIHPRYLSEAEKLAMFEHVWGAIQERLERQVRQENNDVLTARDMVNRGEHIQKAADHGLLTPEQVSAQRQGNIDFRNIPLRHAPIKILTKDGRWVEGESG